MKRSKEIEPNRDYAKQTMRETGRRHHASRAVHMVGLALVVAMTVTGCAKDDPKYRPGTLPPLSPSKTMFTPITRAPTPRGTDAMSDKEQVKAIYVGFVKHYPAAQDVPKEGRRKYLSQWMTEPGLSAMVKGVNEEVAQHQRNFGAFVPHIMSISVRGTRATVNDCMDQSRFNVKDTRTGKVVSSGPDRVWTIVYMKRTSDGWRVSHPTWKRQSCTGR